MRGLLLLFFVLPALAQLLPKDTDKLGILALLDIAVNYRFHWLKCYMGQNISNFAQIANDPKHIQICHGVCVLRNTMYKNLTRVVDYGCQMRQSRYSDFRREEDRDCSRRKSANCSTVTADCEKNYKNRFHLREEHICTDKEISYPHDFTYGSKSSGIITHKFCCDEMLCNSGDAHNSITPAFFNENRDDTLLFIMDIVETVIMFLVFAFMALYPIWLIRVERGKEKLLRTTLQHPLEIEVLENEKKPRIKKVRAKLPQTGMLTLRQLYRVLHTMKEYKRIARPFHERKPSFKLFETQCGGYGHGMLVCHRDDIPRHDNVLIQLLEHGPYAYDWEALEVIELFDCAMSIVDAEPNLLNIALPVAVISDVRGQYVDLHRILATTQYPPRRKLLFIGGIVDPDEPGSLDCLALVCALKIEYPQDVFILRGAPETMPLNVGQRFSRTQESAIQSAAMRLFNFLPLAARLSNRILCVYSGLSHLMSNPGCFTSIHRPFQHNDLPQLAMDILFNQPTMKMSMYKKDTDLGYQLFGMSAVDRVCSDMHTTLIIRGSNPLTRGIFFFPGHKMISLWSAPSKCTEMGSFIIISHRMDVNIISLKAQKNVA